MKRIIAPILWGVAIALSGCGISRQPSITHDELVRRTQEIMDATAPGNPEPWNKYFADDAMYFDEKGRAMAIYGGKMEIEQIPTCDQYTIQGDAFSRAIRENTAVPVPLEDALGNMKVIDAIFRASKSGRWETL